jgi:leader peptidase (prepilin peptidase) / N-methyltransferase
MIDGPATLGLAGVAGLTLGSFAVTFGLRLCRGESAWRGRSRCDACGHTLGFAQTLPVVSFVALSGACTACRARIDPIHLAGEVAGAAIAMSAILATTPFRAGLLAALGLTLIAAVTVDWKQQRLPDRLTGIVAGLAAAAALSVSGAALGVGLAAAGITVGILLGLRALGVRLRGDPGLGLGDVKLLGALAIWLGAMTPWAVTVAAIFGLGVMAWLRPTDGRLAFGPAIAIGAWVVGIGQEAGLWPTMT